MPLSMTGFGEADGDVAGGRLRVEIRSVNHRFFNLAAKLPGDLAAFEGELRERLKREFERGHLAVAVRWTSAPESVTAIGVNAERAKEAINRLRALQEAAGLRGEIPLDLVARQPDVFAAAESTGSSAEWGELEPVVATAAKMCRHARLKEGSLLADELHARLAVLTTEADRITALAPERVTRERDRIRKAVGELLEGHAVDEQRLAQEIA